MSYPAKSEKTGLAKATAILATVFLVSFGLCGVNFVLASTGKNYPGGVLLVTAYMELFGMVGSAAGLLVVAIIALANRSSKKVTDSVSSSEKDEDR